VVESGVVDEVFDAPRMPYTVGLLGSNPDPSLIGQRLTPISGAPPSLVNLPSGCAFSPRCPLVAPVCHESEPELTETSGTVVHLTRCHRWNDLAGYDDPKKLFARKEIGAEEPLAALLIDNPEVVVEEHLADSADHTTDDRTKGDQEKEAAS
jgi:peptide/nickel transport system ATP-binding protein